MTVISKRFAGELGDEKEMRDAYLAAQTRTKIANQIRAIRNQRGWSQGEFAKVLGKPQSNVSRLENRAYGNFTLSTLLELAMAFDCGLVVEFVPYEEFLVRTHDLSPQTLEVPKFSRQALSPLYQTPVELPAGDSCFTADADERQVRGETESYLPINCFDLTFDQYNHFCFHARDTMRANAVQGSVFRPPYSEPEQSGSAAYRVADGAIAQSWTCSQQAKPFPQNADAWTTRIRECPPMGRSDVSRAWISDAYGNTQRQGIGV